MDKGLLSPTLLARVVLLDNVVDLRDGGGDQQAHDEGEDEPVSGSEENKDRVEDAKDSESPTDRVDDNLFAAGSELVYHGAEQQKVDQRPHVKGLGSDLADLEG